jgi:hypothetical protein
LRLQQRWSCDGRPAVGCYSIRGAKYIAIERHPLANCTRAIPSPKAGFATAVRRTYDEAGFRDYEGAREHPFECPERWSLGVLSDTQAGLLLLLSICLLFISTRGSLVQVSQRLRWTIQRAGSLRRSSTSKTRFLTDSIASSFFSIAACRPHYVERLRMADFHTIHRAATSVPFWPGSTDWSMSTFAVSSMYGTCVRLRTGPSLC